ncbi:MAG: STAS domain-containing protein [Rhodobacteraceae bacterium]|nr:STAS domain-containing protein [Paracoccaceae bacterium]
MGKAVLKLDERLDLSNATALAAAILQHADNDLELDASDVTHLGAMGLQVIRSAAKSWDKSGDELHVTGLSTDCADQLQLLGFTPETLCVWDDDG